MKLEGKVAIVTGAAQGIGYAIARRYVDEGAYILCADMKCEVLDVAQELGNRAKAMVLDVSQASKVDEMIDTAAAAWGRVDILCNNAGIAGRAELVENLNESDFDHVMCSNVKSVFLATKAVLPAMLSTGGGSIINIASSAGLIGLPFLSIYSASKSAVIGFTKSAALEYGPSNIRVNAICPGSILTPLNRQHVTEQNYQDQLAKQAIKRIGEASEVAGLAAYLASDESAFVTGAAITIDGGQTAG